MILFLRVSGRLVGDSTVVTVMTIETITMIVVNHYISIVPRVTGAEHTVELGRTEVVWSSLSVTARMKHSLFKQLSINTMQEGSFGPHWGGALLSQKLTLELLYSLGY